MQRQEDQYDESLKPRNIDKPPKPEEPRNGFLQEPPEERARINALISAE